MNSTLVRINPYLLLEYTYDEFQFPTANFRRVESYGTTIITNMPGDATKNGSDKTSVLLPNGSYALLDDDSSYYYPDTDDNVTVNDINIPGSVARYNRVRVHILSGYGFVDNQLAGFLAGFYLRDAAGGQQYLSNYTFHVNNTDDLYFNPSPLNISGLVFDKYVEFYVLSKDWLNGVGASVYSWLVPNGVSDENTVYFEVKSLASSDTSGGVTKFAVSGGSRYAISSVYKFENLSVDIGESSQGDYIEIRPTWDGGSIEDFIYRLNSAAGNDYYIIHDLRFTETIGLTTVETNSISSIQKSDYDKPMRYRPIVTSPNAAAFNLEYTLRLYNSANGSSIFKTFTYTSMEVSKYGRYLQRLAVESVRPIRVYNQINRVSTSPVIPDIPVPTSRTIVTRFVDVNGLVVSNDNGAEISEIIIKPFGQNLLFNITRRVDGELQSIDLSGSSISLVFIKDDGTEKVIPESTNPAYSKSSGQLLYTIDKTVAAEVRRYSDKSFYLVSADGVSIASGTFKKSGFISRPPTQAQSSSNNQAT